MNPSEKRSRAWSLGAVLAVAVAAGVVGLLHPVTALDRHLIDVQFALARSPEPARVELPVEVIVVGIDLETVRAIDEPMTLWHARLGRFLEGMRAAKPAAVAIDLVLPERSYESVLPGLDSALARGLVMSRSTFPTVLAQTVDEDGRHRQIYPAFVSAAGIDPGYALWDVDPDGVIRRFNERLGAHGETVPTLAGQMVRALGRQPREGYIDFSRGAPLSYVPFLEVLESIERGDTDGLRRKFEGKAVFVGSVMPLVDTVRLPVRLAAWGPTAEATPGVILQAHATRVLLADRMLAPVPATAVALLAALAALLSGLLAKPIQGTIVATAVVAGAALAANAALDSTRILPIATIMLAAASGWAGRQGVAIIHRLLERHRLRQSFSGYVSPGVMEEILKGKLSPGADGEHRYVCLLFSDIRGYTTRSESMKPADLLAFLNRYFDGVVDIIHGHGGTVACFMGDGIMAVFGAPQDLGNPCDAAFRAAKAMLENLGSVNSKLLAEGLATIDIGIGLHAGEAVLGHVGGRQRHDYSAIGDVTNVASRLESSTKEAGFRIVLSDEVAGRLPDRAGLVALGPMSLKGHTPVVAHGFDPIGGPSGPVR
ncbi:MAG: adenylate/guanylate cyclase domain-containing protein [Lysobacter sp.]|nr:adenylate/guanylate cyclase domain-containing protein [Lysobacter sp.]